MRDYLVAAGINTGNSLDGADSVVTRFGLDGSVADLASHSAQYPEVLAKAMRVFRADLKAAEGRVDAAITAFEGVAGRGAFDSMLRDYTGFIAGCVRQLTQGSSVDVPVDVVGFHGQTCAHLPPSVAKTRDPAQVYTFQLGDGQALADAIDLPVVFDFRSDDLMNGGEGAPLAPRHHEHLAEHARPRGHFPLAFINGGNTANFSFITVAGASPGTSAGRTVTLGWDAGPFNEFPDQLTRLQKGEPCDLDGHYGSRGKVSEPLLRKLFETAALTREGENFLLRIPPKSSDPQWYEACPELLGERAISGNVLSFEDRIRTAEYFGAYVCMFALTQLPPHLRMPIHFAVCGGGWRNPVTRAHFSQLVNGHWDGAPILAEHRAAFETVRKRVLAIAPEAAVRLSEDYGFDSKAMEARLFADAAVSRIKGNPFTGPETTGAATPTVCGLLRFPGGAVSRSSEALASWLAQFQTLSAVVDVPEAFDPRWSRAAAGWAGRLQKARQAP